MTATAAPDRSPTIPRAPVVTAPAGLRAGGAAALVLAGTFVVGIVMFVTLLADYTASGATPESSVAFVVDHRPALWAWHLVTLIVFAVALVPLVLALHRRLGAATQGLTAVATVFGLVWAGLILATGMIANVGLSAVAELAATDPAQARATWSALDAVTDGLGGGNEIAGGIWVLLVSLAALRSGALPRGLNRLGIACGAAGLVTVVPGLSEVGMAFGLGLVVWFTWVGVTLLRSRA